jgi:hypothetical protein
MVLLVPSLYFLNIFWNLTFLRLSSIKFNYCEKPRKFEKILHLVLKLLN